MEITVYVTFISLALSVHCQITRVILDRDIQTIGKRVFNDRMLYSTNIEEGGKFFRRAKKNILYYGKSNFTIVSSIRFENTHKKYNPVYIRITKGGIGNQYFEASLKSDKGLGFKVQVECYGYS